MTKYIKNKHEYEIGKYQKLPLYDTKNKRYKIKYKNVLPTEIEKYDSIPDNNKKKHSIQNLEIKTVKHYRLDDKNKNNNVEHLLEKHKIKIKIDRSNEIHKIYRYKI